MTVPAALVDIGINLTHHSFEADRDAVIARAKAAGIVHLVITGSSLASSPAAAALAATDPEFLSATAGVHPHHASELDAEGVQGLGALLAAPSVVAVGECGLDYHRDLSPRPAQRRAFELQLELAARTGKPLFLHQRDAHADFVAMLRAAGPARPRAVAHCFTGTSSEAEEYLALGLHVGITGWICDERRGRHLAEVVRDIPVGRLMLETDGPYLLPRSLQPKPASRRNEPVYLREVCRAVAAARGEAEATVAAATTATALAFFGLAPAAASAAAFAGRA
ncbi:MAG TPA: TatD family hydrolase [Steroidobacteraceae bacterium]|nr:TatD family hydrolase [Steroidobacteraceae bacterium]